MLADVLREAVEQSGISRYELAKLADVEQSALSRFVSGERGLNLDSAGKLCEVLGLELKPKKGK